MKCSEMPYNRVDMDEVKKFFEQLIADSKNAKSGEEQFELHKKYYEFMADVWTNIKLGVFNNEENAVFICASSFNACDFFDII